MISSIEILLMRNHHYLHVRIQQNRHICGILGTYATIFRQRGGAKNNKKCQQILDMEQMVLIKYKAALIAIGKYPARNEYTACHDGLEYRFNMLQMNLYTQTRETKKAVPYLRKLLAYEVNYNLDFNHQNFLCCLPLVGIKPTVETVKSVTNKELYDLLTMLDLTRTEDKVGDSMAHEKKRVELKVCNGCGKQESTLLEFKTCNRCEVAFYCSRQCQKSDWKKHKKICLKRQ